VHNQLQRKGKRGDGHAEPCSGPAAEVHQVPNEAIDEGNGQDDHREQRAGNREAVSREQGGETGRGNDEQCGSPEVAEGRGDQDRQGLLARPIRGG